MIIINDLLKLKFRQLFHYLLRDMETNTRITISGGRRNKLI